nr:hypothetical protein [Hypnea sp.]
MTSILLNSLVSWKSLPWKKISQRIFILQEKVYKFAQQCNQYKVHKLQDYILNCSDAKLLAIQEVTDNINNYYRYYDKERYFIKDIEKLYIYQNLFRTQQYSKKIEVIVEYIKQYIIYICLKPEWEARFEPVYKFKLNKIRKSYTIFNISKFFSNQYYICNNCKVYVFSLFYQKYQKYQIIRRFIRRLQALSSIEYYINYWLNYQHTRYALDIEKIYSLYYQLIPSYLDALISDIIFNGIEWYTMNVLNTIISAKNVFNNLYLLYNDNGHLEIYICDFKLKHRYINFIKSIYSIFKFYHLNLNYIFQYKKLKIQNSINTNHDFKIEINHDTNWLSSYNNFEIKTNFYIYKYFLENIKKFLYHYNKARRIKKSNFIKFNKILIYINIIVVKFYSYYYPVVDLYNFKSLLYLLNKILWKFLKKNKQNIFLLYRNQKYLENRCTLIK